MQPLEPQSVDTGSASLERPAATGGPSWWSQVRAALAGAELDYTTGSLTRAVGLLAIPMVLEMSMESTFAVVDAWFVTRLGDAALAAVGLSEALMTIVYAIAFGLAMAATALVARRIGEKNKEGAVRAATSALAIGAIAGALLGVPCFLFAEDLLAAMKAPAEVIEVGGGYAKVVLGFNGVVMLIHLANGVFRGAGDAALAMRTLVIANAINMVLDPCLIFGWWIFPEMGVTGAGVATVIGRSVGVAYQIAMLRRGAGRIALRGPGFRVEPRILLEILRLSAGTVAQFLIATSSWVALTKILAPFGSVALAGYTLALRIVVFALLPAWGVSNAAATLVGQNLGARRPDRAERAVWLTGTYTMAFLALVTVVFVALAPELVAIFGPAQPTAEVAVSALRILSYGYVLYAWGMATIQGFNGAGDTATPTWIHLACFWALEVPLAWGLANTLGLGPQGVFWSVCFSESVLALFAVALFRRGRWKTARIAADVPSRSTAA